jgi:hypothetical protein
MRREHYNPLAGEVGEQVAKADALLGVEAGGGFVHDEQLRVVEQRLGDADPLLHPAREAAQRTLPDLSQVHQPQ